MRGSRGSVVVLAVAILLAAFLPAGAKAAATAQRWSAGIGSGGGQGTATMRVFADGSGSVSVSLKRLTPKAVYGETINTGTCSKVGALIASFPKIRATSIGTASRTSALSPSQAARVRAASSAVVRITTGSRTFCGWFTYGLKLPFAKDSGGWYLFVGYNDGADHGSIPGTNFALDFRRVDGRTAGSPVLAPVSGTVAVPAYDCSGIGWGLTIALDASTRADGRRAYVQLCHLDGPQPDVGTHLTQGQWIGTVTDDPRVGYDNSHVHMALFLNGPTAPDSSRTPVPFGGYWRLEAKYSLADVTKTYTCNHSGCPAYVSSQPITAVPDKPALTSLLTANWPAGPNTPSLIGLGGMDVWRFGGTDVLAVCYEADYSVQTIGAGVQNRSGAFHETLVYEGRSFKIATDFMVKIGNPNWTFDYTLAKCDATMRYAGPGGMGNKLVASYP